MDTTHPNYQVRAVHCDHRADDEAVYEALKRSTAPLTRAWEKLSAAKTIAIKFNQDFRPDQTPYFEGMRQQLVSDTVARALIRLLRENTNADLFFTDISVYVREDNPDPAPSTQLAPLMSEFDVPYVNANMPPFGVYQVPGGGQMFRQYVMPECVMQADAAGQRAAHEKPRLHGHHADAQEPLWPGSHARTRWPRAPVLPPPGAHALYAGRSSGGSSIPRSTSSTGWSRRPAASGAPPGRRTPRITDMLIAGDHPVSTDAVGAYLMGFDPTADWLDQSLPPRSQLAAGGGGGRFRHGATSTRSTGRRRWNGSPRVCSSPP